MNMTITEQLRQWGYKETPVSVVERLWTQYQLLVNRKTKVVANGPVMEGVKGRLRKRIEQICRKRGIGNPFKGEAIEWKING